MDKERSAGLVIVFSIITFGIYFIWWTYNIHKSLYEKLEGKDICSPGMHIVGLFFGCGIYALLWWLWTGKRLHQVGAEKDNGALYLILAVLGVGGIVNPIMMQGDINKIIANKS